MAILSRWLAPAVLAASLGIGALAPAPAQANDDDLVRVRVDLADVVIRGGHPYYRHGDYGYDDRLIVHRDRYGRPVYYRMVPRYDRGGYGYDHRNARCNRNGKCRIEYYDPRYDRQRHYGYDRTRYWDGRRWRYDDDRHRHRDRRWDD